MAAGSVVVSAAGTVTTQTGAAGRLDALLVASANIAGGSAGAAVKQGQASLANILATWLVTELTAQTAATVGPGLSGLQRMPAVTTEDTDTKAPGVAKSVPLSHTT